MGQQPACLACANRSRYSSAAAFAKAGALLLCARIVWLILALLVLHACWLSVDLLYKDSSAPVRCCCCGMATMQRQRGCSARATCGRKKHGVWLAPSASVSCTGWVTLTLHQAGQQAGRHPTGAGLPRRTRPRGAARARRTPRSVHRAAHACVGARRQRVSAPCAAPRSTSAWDRAGGTGRTCMRDGGQAAPPMQTMRRCVRRCRVASRCCSRPRQTVGTACARVRPPCIPLSWPSQPCHGRAASSESCKDPGAEIAILVACRPHDTIHKRQASTQRLDCRRTNCAASALQPSLLSMARKSKVCTQTSY